MITEITIELPDGSEQDVWAEIVVDHYEPPEPAFIPAGDGGGYPGADEYIEAHFGDLDGNPRPDWDEQYNAVDMLRDRHAG